MRRKSLSQILIRFFFFRFVIVRIHFPRSASYCVRFPIFLFFFRVDSFLNTVWARSSSITVERTRTWWRKMIRRYQDKFVHFCSKKSQWKFPWWKYWLIESSEREREWVRVGEKERESSVCCVYVYHVSVQLCIECACVGTTASIQLFFTRVSSLYIISQKRLRLRHAIANEAH